MNALSLANRLGEVYGLTDIGRERTENQDHFAVWETPTRAAFPFPTLCAAVADGMGGHLGGATASREALRIIEQQFRNATEQTVVNQLKLCFFAANHHLYQLAKENPHLQGMGTTCTIAVITPQKLYIGHIGDSRCFQTQKGQLKQLTKDHLYVLEMLERGMLTANEAANHPDKHLLSKALGTFESVKVDIAEYPVPTNSMLALISDGLYNYVLATEISDIIQKMAFDKAATTLIQIANERGGADNITVVLMRLFGESINASKNSACSLLKRATSLYDMKKHHGLIFWVLIILGLSLALIIFLKP